MPNGDCHAVCAEKLHADTQAPTPWVLRLWHHPQRPALLALWLFALLVHTAVFVAAPVCLWPDTGRYLEYGRALLYGQSAQLPSVQIVQIMPLYPLVTAVLSCLVAAPAVALVLLNHLLASFVPLLIYLLLLPRGRALAAVGSVWAILDPSGLALCQSLLTEPLYALLLVCVAWTSLRLANERSLIWAVGTGAALGLAFGCKPVGAGLVLPVVALLALRGTTPSRLVPLVLGVTFIVVPAAALRASVAQSSRDPIPAPALLDVGRRLFNVVASTHPVTANNGPASRAIRETGHSLDDLPDCVAVWADLGTTQRGDGMLLAAAGETLLRHPFTFLQTRLRVLARLLISPASTEEVYLPLELRTPAGADVATLNQLHRVLGQPYLAPLGPNLEQQLRIPGFPRLLAALRALLDPFQLPHLLILLLALAYLASASRAALRDMTFAMCLVIVLYHLLATALVASPLLRYRDVLNPIFLLLGFTSIAGLWHSRVAGWFAQSVLQQPNAATGRARGTLAWGVGCTILLLVGWRIHHLTGGAANVPYQTIPVDVRWGDWIRLVEIQTDQPLENFRYNTVRFIWELSGRPDVVTRERGQFRIRLWRGREIGEALVVDDPKTRFLVSGLLDLARERTLRPDQPLRIETAATFLLFDRKEHETTAQTLALALLDEVSGQIKGHTAPILPDTSNTDVRRIGPWVHIRIP